MIFIFWLVEEYKQKSISSEQFADKFEKLATYEHSKVVFIIGGTFGLSKGVKKRANELLSFSKMTFSYQLMRVILLGQIYLAFWIIREALYHK